LNKDQASREENVFLKACVYIYVVINISAVIYGSDIESRESWIKSGDLDKFHETQSRDLLMEHTGHLFLFHFPLHQLRNKKLDER
jgi:hypothetical protein